MDMKKVTIVIQCQNYDSLIQAIDDIKDSAESFEDTLKRSGLIFSNSDVEYSYQFESEKLNEGV